MCGGTSGKSGRLMQMQQAQEAMDARAREEERQGRVRAGTAKIDESFAGFDDGYYGQRRQSFMDFYNPQLEDQYTKAQKDLTFALAEAGLLNSSIAGEKRGDLLKAYDTQRASLVSRADSDVNALKGRVQGEKSALVSQLNATGDAERASNEALSRTAAIYNEKPEYSPLGDLFGGIGQGIGAIAARRNEDAIYEAAGIRNPRRTAVSYV